MSRRKGPKKQMPKRRNVHAHSLQDRYFYKRIIKSEKGYDRDRLKEEDRKNLVDTD